MPHPQPSASALLPLVVNDEPLRVLPAPPLPTLLEEQLEALRSFFDSAPTEPTRGGCFYRKLLANHYRQLIPPDASVLEIGCGGGRLLELLPNRDLVGVDISEKQVAAAQTRVPRGEFYVGAAEDLELERKFDVIIISETLNYAADVQQIIERLHAVSQPGTRLILNFHSGLWRPLWSLGGGLGLRAAHPPCNWLSSADVRNILGLAGWEVIKQQGQLLLPLPCFGLEKVINRYLAPVLSQLGLTTFQVARPVQHSLGEKSVSVIIPARNEAGNIEAAVRRLPRLGARTEIIFVEGNSTDQTWAEIARVQAAYPDLQIKALRQTENGKGNAVREGFAAASGEILMILDADLTMPPEELPKFYRALVSGRADFANGVRLVYPMQDKAMRFCNFVANKLFGLAFSWALGQSIKDTLCGTKALFKKDYERIAANRAHFGNFDPFGDFDLLFGASRLQLKIADVPIRYRERTYGRTNIKRWSHGVLLLRMLLLAITKIKLI